MTLSVTFILNIANFGLCCRRGIRVSFTFVFEIIWKPTNCTQVCGTCLRYGYPHNIGIVWLSRENCQVICTTVRCKYRKSRKAYEPHSKSWLSDIGSIRLLTRIWPGQARTYNREIKGDVTHIRKAYEPHSRSWLSDIGSIRFLTRIWPGQARTYNREIKGDVTHIRKAYEPHSRSWLSDIGSIRFLTRIWPGQARTYNREIKGDVI